MQRSSVLKRSLLIAAALLATSLLPAGAMFGQPPVPAPAWGSFFRAAQPIVAPIPAAATNQVAPSASIGALLPIVHTSTRVGPIVFTGSETTSCQGTIGTTFAYGIKYLCVDVLVDGAQGQAYRFRWAIDGKPIADKDLGATGTITAQLVNVPDGICYGQFGNCNEPLAIARGSYQVSFFLNNIEYQKATAVIQ